LLARVLRSPLAWLCLILLGLELTAGRLLPFGRAHGAWEAPRNALTKDGWPEYTRAPGPASGELAVIITNSQGLGIETAEARRTYAARLRRRLRTARPDVSLESWASPGLRTAELELLALRAAERRAGLVLVAISLANLDPPRRVSLAHTTGDIALIAADPAIWPRLPRTLLYQRLDARTFVETIAAYRSELVRSRRTLLARAFGGLEKDQQLLLLGHVVRRFRLLDDFASTSAPDGPTPGGRRSQDPRGPRLRERDVRGALRTLGRLRPRLETTLGEAGARVVWVWVPLAVDSLSPADRDRLRSFHRSANRMIERAGGLSVDLSEAIPTRRFYSLGHYDEEGHRLMSRLLWPVLVDELR